MMKTRGKGYLVLLLVVMAAVVAVGCSSSKNTSRTRFWKAFHARYNTFYNGKMAYIDASLEQESGNKDDFTEMIPLYTVGNKSTRTIGTANYDRAIEKAEKAIKLYSIKKRPVWTKKRRKTAKDIEWLNRREYNPFLWKAWMLLGQSQFRKGEFDEAAATFSYMSRLYSTQPAINGKARAWLAISYAELDWLYDAEDVITKMRKDTMHYKAAKDWDYAYADYYIRSKQYEKGAEYLRKVIKHEKRRKQRAREWYLMGQLYAAMGNKQAAYNAYKRCVRQNPPYELEFNAHIAQTEVLAAGRSKKMIRRLRRMAASDKNKDYLDQVYYAMGNIYLTERDTTGAIAAYEKGNSKATRSGVEKGVLLVRLGGLYWDRERYSDAQRCYGEAIGLLDKEREGYEELSKRSKVLDELVPYTDAVYLQDSLQVLAGLPEDSLYAAIDRVIEALKKKEEEERKAQEEAAAEEQLQQAAAQGNRNKTAATTATDNTSGTFYFYNPTAVSQGKTSFQRQWGKRENVDDWQRNNRTVVNLNEEEEEEEEEVAADSLYADSLYNDSTGMAAAPNDSVARADSIASDPHNREYYMAQIPFTEEKKAESDNIIKDGLFNAGVIIKDKLDNLRLAEKYLTRLVTQYADYERNDEAYYHLFLLYSRLGDDMKAQDCIARLKATYPQSKWTVLLSDPYFAENARFGTHIEDSLYGATYDAFKASRYAEVRTNAKLSAERFPLGTNRPKFLFIEGLSCLNDGDAETCVSKLKEVVEKYPESEVTEMAGMIIKGVQAGRTLYGGKFDIDDIWTRRTAYVSADSTAVDTLTEERNTGFVFLLAYEPDSVNANQLLYEMARYNFTNFLVRNFDITVDYSEGIGRMIISGFLNYDEALQYARRLYSNDEMAAKVKGCRRIIISEDNLKMLGTKYSYADYEVFFEEKFAPLEISNEELLNIPETIEQLEEEYEEEDEEEQDDGGFMPRINSTTPQNNNSFDFDDDFYY